ncbi:MAG: hypothetical protein RhofKO_16150 [Rhodothermales bacterium]
MDIQLPPEMAAMADQFPSERSTTHELRFNETASLMKAAPQEEDEDGSREISLGDGSGIMTMRVQGPGDNDNAMYVNFDEEQRIEKRDFLNRTFLISGEANTLQWRLTDERSEFLGYVAQKAVAMRDTTAIEAWFTPEIPVPAGPSVYGGLPGLILVLTVGEGRTSYVAEAVDLSSLEEPIEAPSKGRKVSRDEFDEIVQEKMKEMNAGSSGGSTFIIRGGD